MRVRRLVPVVAFLATLQHAAVSAAQGQTAPVIGDAQPPDQIERPHVQSGLGLMMGVPVGDFHDNVAFSVGASGHLDFGLGRSPISIGVEGTYLWYGSDSRFVPLVGIPDLAVEVDTSNDMYLLHGRVRAQPTDGRIRPYVDGLVGFNYIATTTSVDADDTYESGDSTTHLDDFVLSAGGGGGVQIGFGPAPHSIRLDLSLRYLYGGEARYLTEGDIVWQEDGLVILRPRRSRTDMLMVYVGVAFGR